jgi:chemotaxis protein methyltransferase CheR
MRMAPEPTAQEAPPPEEREFEYSRRDFERARRMIHDRAGIALGDGKAEMVYGRLTKRLRALGLDAFRDYLSLLGDAGHPEWEHFVNALTTNQTDFFRESHHFPILARHVAGVQRRPVRVWSAAAATGEEPYSIAITLCEAFETLTPPARVLATDLDTRVLAQAREGIYALDRVRSMETERLRRFFRKGHGSRTGLARVRDELRELVDFRTFNLREARWDMDERFDAIFCRNVLIYFDKPTQRQVLERLAARLAPDGLYFAGHSESLLHAADLFEPCGRTVYRLARHRRTHG